MASVLIVDDHQIVIEGLSLLLAGIPEVTVTGTANSGEEALTFLKLNPVDMVLLDVYMEGLNGIETCQRITSENPEVKVLALTTANEASLIRKMFAAGASGYLMKNTNKEELKQAIDFVLQGKSFFGAEVSQTILNEVQGSPSPGIPKLSRREKEILKLIIDEQTTAEIAEQLYISFGTVETHRRNIMNKLGARNTAGMVRIALEHNLI